MILQLLSTKVIGATKGFVFLSFDETPGSEIIQSVMDSIVPHHHHNHHNHQVPDNWLNQMEKIEALLASDRKNITFSISVILALRAPSFSKGKPQLRYMRGMTYAVHKMHRLPSEFDMSHSKSVFITMLTNPVDRCFRLVRRQIQHGKKIYSAITKEKFLDQAHEQCSNTQWNFLRPKVPVYRWQDPDLSNGDSKAESWGTTPLRVLQQFALVLISEIIDESLVVLQLTLQLSLGQIMMKSDMIKNRGFNKWEGIPITNNLTAELRPYVQSMNLLDQEMYEIALLALH